MDSYRILTTKRFLRHLKRLDREVREKFWTQFARADLTAAKMRPVLVLFEGNRDMVVPFVSPTWSDGLMF